MKFTSIQGRLGLIFLAFALLVIVSVGATYWGLDTQRKDALVINLAGRQRMLVQQMTRLALQIESGGDEGDRAQLQGAVSWFEQTLSALQVGGPAPYLPNQSVDLPPPPSEEIRLQLSLVQQTWEQFRTPLDNLLSGTSIASVTTQDLEDMSAQLVERADLAVRLFEAAATRKVTRLRAFQAVFFTSALLLLATGGWITKKSVLDPLKTLGQASQRIGQGNMDTPVAITGPDETAQLASTFESMRGQLRASHEKLITWAETLDEQVTQRTRELNALYEVSRDISSQLDVQHVLSSVTEKTRQLLAGDVATLCLLDEHGQVLAIRAHSGPAEAIIGRRTNCRSGLAGQVLSDEKALRCSDVECKGVCGILAKPFCTSHLAAPLIAGKQVIGALCVGSTRPESFSEESAELLTKLSSVAAVALENARLYERAELAAILEERQRIAADMHDGLLQSLSYIGLINETAQEQLEGGQAGPLTQSLGQIKRALEQAEREARRAISSLGDKFPVHLSLQDQLVEAAAQASTRYSPVAWESNSSTPILLPHQSIEQILRVVREALLNARRHSQASHITLRLEVSDSQARVSVEDDGVGFDPQAPLPDDGRRHFGIAIMRIRAARISGQVEVRSSPGKGTCVVLSWPLNPNPLQVEALSTSETQV